MEYTRENWQAAVSLMLRQAAWDAATVNGRPRKGPARPVADPMEDMAACVPCLHRDGMPVFQVSPETVLPVSVRAAVRKVTGRDVTVAGDVIPGAVIVAPRAVEAPEEEPITLEAPEDLPEGVTVPEIPVDEWEAYQDELADAEAFIESLGDLETLDDDTIAAAAREWEARKAARVTVTG